MGIIKKIINIILSFFKKTKSQPEGNPFTHMEPTVWIATSREDQRRYKRYCKRKGFHNVSGLPDHITSQAHSHLKRLGVIK